VFVGHTGELYKTDEPIEMPFGAHLLGPKKLVLDGNPDLAQRARFQEDMCRLRIRYSDYATVGVRQ